MPGDAHRLPLTAWSRPAVVATAAAYRTSLGERGEAMAAFAVAEAAFLAAGGAPERARDDVPLIVTPVARDHPDWLYRPARERIAREERWWKARGVWPPPKHRSGWPAEPL